MRSKLSAIGRTALVLVVVALIIAAGAAGYLAGSSRTVTSTVTTTAVPVSATVHSTYVNTFFSTSCSISGVGGFEIRLVSDSTGAPVNADSITAVDKLECIQEPSIDVNQVVYLNQFSYLGDGWFIPIFPSQATVGGGLNITVTYEGKTYNFGGYYPPIGTDCVTLGIPSGILNSTTVMNGSGSFCSQEMITSSSNGLEFSMSLNSSTVSKQNSDLSVSLNLFNTLELSNNITGASSWRLTNQSEEWPGHWNCAQNDVFRIEVRVITT